MTQNLTLLTRFGAILKFMNGEDGSGRPDAVIRPSLPDALRVTQSELLAALGAKRRKELDKKLSHAVIVASRLHTGKDCYRSIRHAVDRLEREIRERENRRSREAASLRRSLQTQIRQLHPRINILKRELGEEPLSTDGLDDMSIDELRTTHDLFEEEWNGVEMRFEERIYRAFERLRRANRLPAVPTKGGQRNITQQEFHDRALGKLFPEERRLRRAA